MLILGADHRAESRSGEIADQGESGIAENGMRTRAEARMRRCLFQIRLGRPNLRQPTLAPCQLGGQFIATLALAALLVFRGILGLSYGRMNPTEARLQAEVDQLLYELKIFAATVRGAFATRCTGVSRQTLSGNHWENTLGRGYPCEVDWRNMGVE
jgi:hypothetical protein